MASPEIKIKMFYRAKYEEMKDDQHTQFAERLSKIGEPLGFDIGPCPKFGKNVIAGYNGKHKSIKGLRYGGHYLYKSEINREDFLGVFGQDESFEITFRMSNKSLDYKEILHIHYPKVIEAYMPYRGVLYFDNYFCTYTGGYQNINEDYDKLCANEALQVDGRNNIYTLHPAQFWDKQLCELALGYGPEEVIRRLRGAVFQGAAIPLITPLLDGVYIVLNDDPKLYYDTYVAMNRFYKDLLGLI